MAELAAAPAPRGPARRKALRRFVLGAGATLLALEAFLQLVAGLAWRRAWVGPVGTSDPNTVLVCGDGSVSEEGLASREEAWPARVAARARALHSELRIVAGAASGRDSHDVATRLQRQLDVERPRFVYLRVGVEDLRAGRAAPITDEELPGRAAPFRVEFRTLRALRDAWEALFCGDAIDPTGIWHSGGVAVEFGANGRLRLGPAEGLWERSGDGLQITLPGAAPIEVTLTRTASGIDLSGAFPGGQLSLVAGAPARDAAGEARALLDRGEFAEARWVLTTAAESSAPDADALAALVELDRREGRREDAARHLAQLKTLAGVSPTAAAAFARAEAASSAAADAVPAPAAEERARRAAVLRGNLARIVALCRFHGAEPILLGPLEAPEALAVCEAVATEGAVALLRSTAQSGELERVVFADLAARLGG